ncbi:MAG: helix-turn-helix domain-containing protein [Candidatus Bathyarchaeota archaeon]|nr:MAG: helix-turn-helix domain-containing protein [Candidatus Bathyarchaeota archaeon]
MPLFEVVLKVTHDCPFGNISRKFPSLKMFEWCNREHEVFEMIVPTQEDYAALMEEVSKLSGIIDMFSDRGKVHLVTKSCYCSLENSVTSNIDACNLLHVAPIVYEQGWEYYRVIAFRHEDLEELLQRLEKKGVIFEILRKVPFDSFIASSLTLTADALFSDLTGKQIDALLTAYRNGYYQLPRKADVKIIAFKERVPRTTFQEHLKKAENKLVAALIPYIKLFNHAPKEKKQKLKMPARNFQSPVAQG